jgi:hypothetical protein
VDVNQSIGPRRKTNRKRPEHDFLLNLLGHDPDWVGVKQRRHDGGKYYLPSPCSDDVEDVIEQHLMGVFRSRPCRVRNQVTDQLELAEREPLGFSAYCLRPRDGTFTVGWIALDLDVAGAGHSTGIATAEQASELASAMVEQFETDGLSPVLERSQGGQGYHVWLLFDEEQPAAFGNWLGQQLKLLAEGLRPDWPRYAVEAFPKQAAAKQWPGGSMLALPFNGNAVHPQGGRLIWPDGSLRPLSTIHTTNIPDYVGEAWLSEQEHIPIRADLSEVERRRRNILSELRHGQDGGTTCEEVILLVAPKSVTRETATTLYVKCPRHESRSGESLHIDRSKDCWYCHGCNQGGGSTLLMQWFSVRQAIHVSQEGHLP